MLNPGDRVGNYRLDEEVACDELGAAYQARHLVLPRRALIKVMHAEAAQAQPRAVHLLREACILDALHHPGIVRVYESGLLPDRRPWFASEDVDGPALTTVLAPGSIPRTDAVALLRDLAGVLEHAHYRGVVHGSVDPARVILAGGSRGYPLCVADWSTARTHDAAPAPIGAAAAWPYAAPEVVAGDPIDDRADVFALGVIAYQMLTGGLPVDTGFPLAVRCPDIPRELATLIDQMLAFARWDRPSSSEVHGGLAWGAEQLARAGAVRIRRPRWTPPLSMDAQAVPVPIAADGTSRSRRALTDRDE